MKLRLCRYLAPCGALMLLLNAALAFAQELAYPITGSLTDGGGNPITNVQISASTTNSANIYTVNTITDTNGNYLLYVTNGTWAVAVNCCASGNCANVLATGNYQCPSQKNVTISNDNAVVNFVAVTWGSPLPNGRLGAPYSASIGNVGDRNSYNADLSNGILPPGLNFVSQDLVFGLGGSVIGKPNQLGTFPFTFEVPVIGGFGPPAEANYTITITEPNLQIITASLTMGPVGRPSLSQLQAAGGTVPYVWSLTPGSPALPAMLTLSTNGLISGVPASAGVYTMIVSVTDSNSLAASAEVQITFISAVTLASAAFSPTNGFQFKADAPVGQNYTVQYSSTLTNWLFLLTTNPTLTPFSILDPGATDRYRFYRLLLDSR